jgi:hypothetical protein
MKLICSILLFAITLVAVGCGGSSSSTPVGGLPKDKLGSAEPPKAPEIPK